MVSLYTTTIFNLPVFILVTFTFYAPNSEKSGDILIYPLFVHPFVRPSGYRYMVFPAISYSFGATASIFFRMFIHIMEMCMSTGF
jgi:hypothetical protein